MRCSASRSLSRQVLAACFAIGFAGLVSHARACLPIRSHLRVGADTAHCQANDIQSAINAAGSCPTVIDITREHTYTDQHLSVVGKNITFQGWGDGVTCADIPDEFSLPTYTPPVSNVPLVTLNGSGGGRVLSITGNSNVALRNLDITGGLTDDTATGGGIDFYGQGSLYLVYSVVNNNQAGYGAGINMNGASGPASLTLDTYSQILVNTATKSGGGIRMLGQSRLYALKPQTLIGFNHADNGYGGGIEVLGPARADIGSPGFNGLGVLYDNTAEYGGGIDILTFDVGSDATVRLFTTDPNNPVQMSGNFASHTGGAVYLKSLENFGFRTAFSQLCAHEFRVENNAAPEGAAIYSDADYSIDNYAAGGTIAFNSELADYCDQIESPSSLGAVMCAQGVPCNRFFSNKAEDSSGNPTNGSTILLQDGSTLSGNRFSMRANTGAHVIRELGDINENFANLTNCLLADNMLSQELIALTDGNLAILNISSCTIVGNTIGAPYAFLAPGSFSLNDSIIDAPGRATVDPSITDGALSYNVLTNDRSTLPDTVYIQQGTPSYVNAANGDYHLTRSSLGVDAAPAGVNESKLDLDGGARVVDLVGLPNNFGPMDLGAYEIQSACSTADTIFCDGFEPQ